MDEALIHVNWNGLIIFCHNPDLAFSLITEMDRYCSSRTYYAVTGFTPDKMKLVDLKYDLWTMKR